MAPIDLRDASVAPADQRQIVIVTNSRSDCCGPAECPRCGCISCDSSAYSWGAASSLRGTADAGLGAIILVMRVPAPITDVLAPVGRELGRTGRPSAVFKRALPDPKPWSRLSHSFQELRLSAIYVPPVTDICGCRLDGSAAPTSISRRRFTGRTSRCWHHVEDIIEQF